MLLTTNTGTIAALWDALGRQEALAIHRDTLRAKAELGSVIKEAVKTGSVGVIEAEILVYAAGIGLTAALDRDTLALLGAGAQPVYKRPGRTPRDIWACNRISAVDLANAMMRLEEAGLLIDPAPLCEALVPSLEDREFLTSAELAVYWHARERHRRAPLILATGPNLTFDLPDAKHRTASGYRAELFRNNEGEAIALKVTAPRWRRRRPSFALAA